MGILTSNSAETVKHFIKKYNLDLFAFIHSEKNLFGKDRALNTIIEERKLNKDKTIYIGDEVRDIESCNKIGLSIVAVSWGFNEKGLLSKSNPTYLIEEPQELLSLL